VTAAPMPIWSATLPLADYGRVARDTTRNLAKSGKLLTARTAGIENAVWGTSGKCSVLAFAAQPTLASERSQVVCDSAGVHRGSRTLPYSGDELSKLRAHAADDLLAFLLLRWTGLRGSDAVGLSWNEVHFDRREIERVTQKRKKKVIVPIHTELLFALEAARDQRHPQGSDCVLLNPETGGPLDRPRLYKRLVGIGGKAPVPNARPHRFRDTLAVDMLSRGASPYDVAKILGDTIETVERHYTPFVKELRDRVRSILEGPGGHEARVTPVSQTARSFQ